MQDKCFQCLIVSHLDIWIELESNSRQLKYDGNALLISDYYWT